MGSLANSLEDDGLIPNPFQLACEAGDLIRVKEIFESQDRDPTRNSWDLAYAAMAGQAHIVRYLFEKGTPIEAWALSDALKGGFVPVLDVFVEYGWNPREEGHLYWRSALDHESSTRWLLEHGADPNRGHPRPRSRPDSPDSPDSPDRNPGCALNCAAIKCRLDIFQLLLDHGADIKHAFPLHYVARQKKLHLDPIPVLQHFIDLGFDVNGSQPYRHQPSTPLEAAIWARNFPVMRFLIKHGADSEDMMRFAKYTNDLRVRRICQGVTSL